MSRLYLRDTTDNVAGYSSGEQANVLPTGTLAGTSGSPQDLSLLKGAAQVSQSLNSAAQTSLQSGYFRKFISEPLRITDIEAQNWTIAIAAQESNSAANTFLALSIYVLTASDTVRGYVFNSDQAIGTEWATSANGRVATISGSPLAGIISTDRLCVEIWYRASQSMASSYVNTIYYNGTNDPVDGQASSSASSYVDTPQDLFPAAAPTELTGAGSVIGGGLFSGIKSAIRSTLGSIIGGGRLLGQHAVEVSKSGLLSGAGLIRGQSQVDITRSGILSGGGRLSGKSELTRIITGTISGAGSISGARNVESSRSGTVSGPGEISGTSQLSTIEPTELFGSGAVIGSGTISGPLQESRVITGVVSGSGSISGSGQLVEVGPVDLVASGTISGSGSISGSGQRITQPPPPPPDVEGGGSPNLFLRPAKYIYGRVADLFLRKPGATIPADVLLGRGTISGTGILRGTREVESHKEGAIAGQGELSGSGVLVFEGATFLEAHGAVAGEGSISGSGQLVDLNAPPPPPPPIPGGGIRRRLRRRRVTRRHEFRWPGDVIGATKERELAQIFEIVELRVPGVVIGQRRVLLRFEGTRLEGKRLTQIRREEEEIIILLGGR